MSYIIEADLDAATPTAHHDMRGQFNCAADALAFMTAGKATVTLLSKKTATRFTYRLTAAEDDQAHFVALLTGPNNLSNYQYIGRISRNVYWHGRKIPRPGDIARDAPSALAFDWAWRALVRGQLPAQLEIWHQGRCGRCARKLTAPASIARGFCRKSLS